MKKIVDGIEVDLSPEELLDMEERELEHSNYLADIAKVRYKSDRQAEYPTIEDLVVALIENLEGRPEALNLVIDKRKQIKNKYPKPTQI